VPVILDTTFFCALYFQVLLFKDQPKNDIETPKEQLYFCLRVFPFPAMKKEKKNLEKFLILFLFILEKTR
jgi:hypothetical protein